MLSLTRKADYAILAMSELARRAPARTSARQLAEEVSVPLPMLTNILNQLLHCGLVASTRGALGGYCLAKDPGRISLREMIEAVEGPTRFTLCCNDADAQCDEGSQKCEIEPTCRIKAPVQRVHESLRDFLGRIDLSHIAFDRVPVPLVVRVGNKADQVTETSAFVTPVANAPSEQRQ